MKQIISEDDHQLEEMENTDPIYDNNDAAANFLQNLVPWRDEPGERMFKCSGGWVLSSFIQL